MLGKASVRLTAVVATLLSVCLADTSPRTPIDVNSAQVQNIGKVPRYLCSPTNFPLV